MTVRSPLYNKIGYGLPTDGSSTEVGFKLSNGSGHCFRRFHRFRSVHTPARNQVSEIGASQRGVAAIFTKRRLEADWMILQYDVNTDRVLAYDFADGVNIQGLLEQGLARVRYVYKSPDVSRH